MTKNGSSGLLYPVFERILRYYMEGMPTVRSLRRSSLAADYCAAPWVKDITFFYVCREHTASSHGRASFFLLRSGRDRRTEVGHSPLTAAAERCLIHTCAIGCLAFLTRMEKIGMLAGWAHARSEQVSQQLGASPGGNKTRLARDRSPKYEWRMSGVVRRALTIGDCISQ